jgi:ATP-binding cassette subfamily B protein
VFFDELIQVVRLQALARVGMESLAGLSVVVVVLVGGFQVIDGRLTWPALFAFVMAVRALRTPLNLIHDNYVKIRTLHSSVWRIAEFLATRPAVTEQPGAEPLASAPRVITCEEIGFAHGEDEALWDVSFSVSAGETVGIVGLSGAGKTTLLNLMTRLYDPSSGRVLFDGVDLKGS